MLRSIRASVRQALTGKAFWWGTAGTAAVLLSASAGNGILALRGEGMPDYGLHHRLIMDALSSQGMTLALPLLAALPFTSSLADDMRSGLVKEYLPRATEEGYLWGKAAACVLSGGLTLVLGILTAYGLAALFLMPMEAAPGSEIKWAPYFAEIAERCTVFFSSGGFWSMVGMLFATWTGSRYMAYASPFVCYYMLIILCERYFREVYMLYPKEWVEPSKRWMFGSGGVICFVWELTAIVALLFMVVARRRLSRI